jgi:hypothetical protein
LFKALIFIALSHSAMAQRDLLIRLPDVKITADRIIRGDGDTYGLGDWRCAFTLKLEGAELLLDGAIVFSENANDFTTIVGEYHRRIAVGELERCRTCKITLDETYGTVSGPNIGARGYRWFGGQGLVRRANVQTDTFGEDARRIGGTVQFRPLKIRIDCPVALGEVRGLPSCF